MRGSWAAVAVSDEITARSRANCGVRRVGLYENESQHTEAKERHQSIVLRLTRGRAYPITIVILTCCHNIVSQSTRGVPRCQNGCDAFPYVLPRYLLVIEQ